MVFPCFPHVPVYCDLFHNVKEFFLEFNQLLSLLHGIQCLYHKKNINIKHDNEKLVELKAMGVALDCVFSSERYFATKIYNYSK